MLNMRLYHQLFEQLPTFFEHAKLASHVLIYFALNEIDYDQQAEHKDCDYSMESLLGVKSEKRQFVRIILTIVHKKITSKLESRQQNQSLSM